MPPPSESPTLFSIICTNHNCGVVGEADLSICAGCGRTFHEGCAHHAMEDDLICLCTECFGNGWIVCYHDGLDPSPHYTPVKFSCAHCDQDACSTHHDKFIKAQHFCNDCDVVGCANAQCTKVDSPDNMIWCAAHDHYVCAGHWTNDSHECDEDCDEDCDGDEGSGHCHTGAYDSGGMGTMSVPPWETRGQKVEWPEGVDTSDGDMDKACVMWGVDRTNHRPDRDAADFYLLEAIKAGLYYDFVATDDMLIRVIREQATEAQQKLVDRLDPVFCGYVDMVCGGELRHHRVFKSSLRDATRPAAWMAWKSVRQVLGVEALEDAAVIFEDFAGRSFGGFKWAECCRALHARLTGKITATMFIDRVFNLEHNGGCVLNKVNWQTGTNLGLIRTIIGPSHSNYDMVHLIVTHATKPTQRLWNDWLKAVIAAATRNHMPLHPGLSTTSSNGPTQLWFNHQARNLTWMASHFTYNEIALFWDATLRTVPGYATYDTVDGWWYELEEDTRQAVAEVFALLRVQAKKSMLMPSLVSTPTGPKRCLQWAHIHGLAYDKRKGKAYRLTPAELAKLGEHPWGIPLPPKPAAPTLNFGTKASEVISDTVTDDHWMSAVQKAAEDPNVDASVLQHIADAIKAASLKSPKPHPLAKKKAVKKITPKINPFVPHIQEGEEF